MVMASAILSPACLCSASSSTTTKSAIVNLSSSVILHPKSSTFHLYRLFPPKGLGCFSPWSGLKHLGISMTPKSLRFESKRKFKDRVAYASLFGVGAPEALVIGVVALLIFGPKGLAEVARTLGKTLRAFQPTIRELQEVSKDFKSTLEKEIGLDDISGSTPFAENYKTNNTSSPSSVSNTGESKVAADPNGTSSGAYTTEEYLKITEEQLKAAASQQQIQSNPLESSSSPDGATTAEENLKVAEEQQKPSAGQEQGQTSSAASDKETASSVPSSQQRGGKT
ncbi:hypothetical protein UlMin_024533 [Ulmus minor]